ncbi:MAG: hypothetical protein ABJF11_11175 [Reichenbachiella sp.]|uniref:hypothetical protein n=1 Tax=Reichenbachiella sp. TaxID=2184521 RepID=UPI0032674E83
MSELDEEIINIPEHQAKELYSKTAIRGFSFFFSTIFGGVLLYSNLRALDKTDKANSVLLFSVIYAVVTIYFLTTFENAPSYLTYIVNIIGAMILTEYFHKNYIGDEVVAEKKSIWKPLIISLLITSVLVGIVILGIYM